MAEGRVEPGLDRWQADRRLCVGTEQAGRHWLTDDRLGPGRQRAGQEMLSRQIKQDA